MLGIYQIHSFERGYACSNITGSYQPPKFLLTIYRHHVKLLAKICHTLILLFPAPKLRSHYLTFLARCNWYGNGSMVSNPWTILLLWFWNTEGNSAEWGWHWGLLKIFLNAKKRIKILQYMSIIFSFWGQVGFSDVSQYQT